jgi:hypothetical protein
MTALQSCIKCKKELPLDSYYKDKSKAGGVYTKCRPCVIEYESSRKQERSPVDHVRMSLHLGTHASVPLAELITLWNEATNLHLPRISNKEEPLLPL